MTNDQQIRQQSLAWLEPRGFRVAEWLPLSGGDFDKLRPANEIAARVLALKALFAFVVAPVAQVPSEALTPFFVALTNQEREIVVLDRAQAHQEHVDTIGWKLENMWPLAWVLGFEPEPTIEGSQLPDEVQSALLFDFLPAFDVPFEEWLGELRPRSHAEVAALEDRFYCAHNAVRSAQLGGDTVPPGFHPILHGGAVHERRHALTWCLSPGVAWDDTDLST